MAEIEWKGAIWKAAYGDLSIKDLLTTLKGYGPMEILEFEKAGVCRGQISLCLSEKGPREVTIHDLEIRTDKNRGQGRATVRWLRDIFKGDLLVDYPDLPPEAEASEGSLPFWVKMYHEGLIDGLECGLFCLVPEMSETELHEIEEKIRNLSMINRASPGRDEGQR